MERGRGPAFPEAARSADDPFYAAYVLSLVLGMRKGEVLRLTWELMDLDAGELFVGEQLQRVGRRLLRGETKTESSDAPLPLPGICAAALAGGRWEIYTTEATSDATRAALKKLGESLGSEGDET